MQKLSRTLVNPTHGYTVYIIESHTETNGAYTHVEVTLPPGEGTPLHYHLDFTEEFEALEGTLELQLGKTIIHLQPGDKAALVPTQAHHRFFNPNTTPIKFRAIIRPARNFEATLRITYGLAKEGLCNKKGIPKSLLTLAIVYQISESYLPGLPFFIQKGIFGILAKIARRKGVDKKLEKYYVGSIEPAKSLNKKVLMI
jgi:mannose-6-phosphate isomerase-like protein (cupin superfamily)